MYVYTLFIKDNAGKVVYSNEEYSGHAHMDDIAMARKSYPESKGFTFHTRTAERKRVSYSAEEGH